MSVRSSALLACLLIAGCAMPVREQPLRDGLDPITTLQWRGFVDEKLRGQVMLGELKGSDPEAVGYLQQTLERVWSSRAPAKPLRDAMEEQLHELRLLANAALPARYALDAEILSLGGGSLPLSSEGEVEVRYRLREIESGACSTTAGCAARARSAMACSGRRRGSERPRSRRCAPTCSRPATSWCGCASEPTRPQARLSTDGSRGSVSRSSV